MAELIRRPGRNAGWGVFGDDFDNLFEGFLRPLQGAQTTAGGALLPAVDIAETDNTYTIRADLPGIKKEDIEVTVHDGVLTLSAESKNETEEKREGRVIRQERRYGRFLRSLRLGALVDESKLKASYRDGVLEITIPKTVEAAPRKIAVEVA